MRSVVALMTLFLLVQVGTAWADTGSAGSPQASTFVWPLLGAVLVWLGLALRFRKLFQRRLMRRVAVRLTILATLTLYFATLGPHLGHHITEASATETDCTVLIVIDSTYTGLAAEEPPPVPAPEPVFVLPVPKVPSHPAVFYFASTHSRAPPGASLDLTRL